MTSRSQPFTNLMRALVLATALGLAGATAASAAPEKAPGGVRFTYTDPNASAVSLAGEFNGWNTTATPMTREGDVWSVVVPLGPGEHQYKFVVDGQWLADPTNPLTGGDFGNSLVRVAQDGSVAAAAPASISPYNPRIGMNGRVIGLYQTIRSGEHHRYEIRRPNMTIDLGFDIRISEVLQAEFLMKIDSEKEDVQDYRSRLNFDRGSLRFTKPDLQIVAYDNEAVGTWDDPMRLVGGIGVFDHEYGYQRQGFKVTTPKFGFDTELHYADHFRAGGTDYRTFGGPNAAFNFESNPAAAAIRELRTERVGSTSGFSLVPGQFSKLTTMDLGDFNEDMFAVRTRRALPGGLTIGLLGRSDRGFNIGRIVMAEPVADSTVRLLNGPYERQWMGGGLEASWQPREGLRVFGELLGGALRMTLVNDAALETWAISSITASSVTGAFVSKVPVAGDHRTIDESRRLKAGAAWTFAQGDIALRADVEYQTHALAAWTQPPEAPAGQANPDNPINEGVEYQRATYLDPENDLENSMTRVQFGWDRNWRHYLDRAVLTTLDVDWTAFDYDPRTVWQNQFWFPYGNFWMEAGEHVAYVDRLTLLGGKDALRIRPTLQVPLLASRNMTLKWLGTISTVGLDKRPSYWENVVQYGFDLTDALRLNTDTRWARYDDPDLGLHRGYLDLFAEAEYRFAPGIRIALSWGVDPWVIDPAYNDYRPIGRDLYLFTRNANGYYAETNYLSQTLEIDQAERALRDEKRVQLEAVIHF